MKTNECQEVNLMSFDDFTKDILADKRLMNKKVRCCFCEELTDKLMNMTSHLDICKETLFDTEMKKIENRIIKIKFSDLINEINEKNSANEEYRNQIASLEAKIERMEMDFNNKIQEIESTFKCNIEELQNKLKNSEDHIEELTDGFPLIFKNEIERLEKETLYFLWIINDIQKKIDNSEKIFSPVFYTNKMYKMRLQLNANGNVETYRDYLSLYFNICRGKYDDDLIWPFASNVKFELVHFTDGTKNITRTIVAKSNESSYQKPTTDYNAGYGFTTFHNNKYLAPDFIKNNSIWIRFYPNV